MRLKPAVTAGEAFHFLSLNAGLVWGLEEAALMEADLRAIAAAMESVSSLTIADHVEPLFGGDSSSDMMEYTK
jgi:hypothetical protein